MGLFDVLRYPISDQPTVEELAALPRDLYNVWRTSVGWYVATNESKVKYYSEAPVHVDILMLREMIKNYEPI